MRGERRTNKMPPYKKKKKKSSKVGWEKEYWDSGTAI